MESNKDVSPDTNSDEANNLLPYKGYTFGQKLTRFVIGFFGFFILTGLCLGGYLALSKHVVVRQPENKKVVKQIKTVAAVTPSTSPIVTAPADWQVFANADHTYSIPFPAEYTVSCGNKYSCTFSKSADNPSTVYISTIPADMKDSKGQIEYFDADEIKILSTIKINETKITRKNTENPGLDQYYSFKRLPDEIVSGKKALVFENSKPWEKPAGTIEKRYIVTNNNTIFIFGGYLIPDSVTLTQLRQMLSGVEFF
jgi:hypothetical protein